MATKLETLTEKLEAHDALISSLSGLRDKVKDERQKIWKEIKPLMEAAHRKKIRGMVGAWVKTNYGGKDAPLYGQHVRIVGHTQKYAYIDFKVGGKGITHRWKVGYQHLSTSELPKDDVSMNRVLKRVMG